MEMEPSISTMSEDWRQGSIMEQQKHMLESGFMSDCSFLVGQEPDIKVFCAHKYNLSRSSEVFHTMFYGSLSEKEMVQVTDVTPAAFQALLDHVYCDSLDISDVEMALSVSFAAHKYNLQRLSNKCTQYLRDHMTPVNVLQVLEFSNLTDNLQLKQHCINLLQSDTEAVLSADSWCDASESNIITLLQQDTLNIDSELILLNACHCWALHQLNVNNESVVDKEEEKLRKIVSTLLCHLRVLNLTAQQFVEAKENNIYSEQEQFLILKRIASPDKHTIPEHLCQISSARNTPCSVDKMLETDEKILEELKSHLKVKDVRKAQFHFSSKGCIKNSECTLGIKKNIVIYGFQFHTLKAANEDSIALALAKNKEYGEKFTLQFLKDKVCVAEFVFNGKLKYDVLMRCYFPKPFLAKKMSELRLVLQFNNDVTKNYQIYCNEYTSDRNELKVNFLANDGVFTSPQFYFCCLSGILYKAI